MNSKANYDGLKTNPLRIESGEIIIESIDEAMTFKIGDLDDLTVASKYSNGTYTDENGLEIDLKEFISNMRLDPVDTRKLKRKPGKESETDNWSSRMSVFEALLERRLSGKDIKGI